MANFCLSEVILERFQSVENELGRNEHIIKLDCNRIDTWEFRDRKSFELGDIDELALSIQRSGQCQPIILVKASEQFKPKDNPTVEFVVIAGYRRWMACKKYDMQVQAIVRELSFDQAITSLVAENEKENVSDYSKGMFYHTLLTSEKITQDQLSRRLNISPSTLNMFLAFAQVPADIWISVGDLSRVSARTASVVRAIVNKGTLYVDALKAIGHKISQGYGEKRLQEAVELYIDKKLERTPKNNMRDRVLKWNGKKLMTMHHGRIKLEDVLVNERHYPELIEKLEKEIENFANFYLDGKKKK